MKICPIVLSGGVGSRLWPLSREHYPKQCLNLTDSLSSLLQKTLLRTNRLDVQSPLVVCNDDHRFLIAQQPKKPKKLRLTKKIKTIEVC